MAHCSAPRRPFSCRAHLRGGVPVQRQRVLERPGRPAPAAAPGRCRHRGWAPCRRSKTLAGRCGRQARWAEGERGCDLGAQGGVAMRQRRGGRCLPPWLGPHLRSSASRPGGRSRQPGLSRSASSSSLLYLRAIRPRSRCCSAGLGGRPPPWPASAWSSSLPGPRAGAALGCSGCSGSVAGRGAPDLGTDWLRGKPGALLAASRGLRGLRKRGSCLRGLGSGL